MDKEELLLSNYVILSKNPQRNEDALLSAIQQLIEINPNLGIRCWEECIRDHLTDIEPEFRKEEFIYKSKGYILVHSFEHHLLRKSTFVSAINEFANNRFLLEVLYTKSPIYEYFCADYPISYLIRTNQLQDADNIISSIYKNNRFKNYSHLWDNIINRFQYGEEYNPSVYFSADPKQPEHIRNFCIAWIDRIKDEEEKAGAMTFAIKMF